MAAPPIPAKRTTISYENVQIRPSLDSISWYHGNITRHIAEALLMANGMEGSYLLRDGKETGSYSLSVRSKDSVKHFQITQANSAFKFGITEFESLESLIGHFANQPLLGGNSGTLVLLKYPYPKQVEEPDNYEDIVLQSTVRSGATEEDLKFQTKATSLASKEGFLTKQGWVVKNWKTRWFVLSKYDLSYFSDRSKEKPIKTLNLLDCQGCIKCDDVGKKNCFKLDFPDRTWYFYANTEEEQAEWMDIIKWKLKQIRKDSM
ncbi:dual adapter for phosphotyrosine and 3-phosphotyrosine and 3-phosphoinositide-like [Styela clava]|uniref:dual adapter for phosphotyrosine and 3-phosphotyrosine and 3-phosphoinositide-like n=1 Tax=Styela clava TaxID=7725 RepID=UPI001939C5EC|nr:dual adapter for phosphotyrosine and 3-phosphotyrosine and 3-phosphoinositide-like [Styela clava]